MATHTSMLHIRVDAKIKAEATAALEAMGLSMSDAVRLFLRRVVADQAFPLELKVPNATTRAAMEESRAMMAARRARFESADELFADLKKRSRKLARGAAASLMSPRQRCQAKPYGLMPAANCCRRSPSARASFSNWFQSSGG